MPNTKEIGKLGGLGPIPHFAQHQEVVLCLANQEPTIAVGIAQHIAPTIARPPPGDLISELITVLPIALPVVPPVATQQVCTAC